MVLLSPCPPVPLSSCPPVPLSSSSCSKELNQWEPLTEYGQSKGHSNPYLVLECAWRVSNWAAMKEALVQVRARSPCHATRHAGKCHPMQSAVLFEAGGMGGRRLNWP